MEYSQTHFIDGETEAETEKNYLFQSHTKLTFSFTLTSIVFVLAFLSLSFIYQPRDFWRVLMCWAGL